MAVKSLCNSVVKFFSSWSFLLLASADFNQWLKSYINLQLIRYFCYVDFLHLKVSTTIFLLLLIFVQSFVSLVYDIDFWLNKDYIAANLCVNKDKPQMHCNGKCFLAKEKQDAEKQSQQPNSDKKDKFEIQPFFLPETTSVNCINVSIGILYGNEKNVLLTGYTNKLFHPPCWSFPCLNSALHQTELFIHAIARRLWRHISPKQ